MFLHSFPSSPLLNIHCLWFEMKQLDEGKKKGEEAEEVDDEEGKDVEKESS